MSLKQNRIIKIVMEFVKAEDTYDITGIDLGLAKFFYREPQMLFQDLAKGDYTISTNGGKQTLTIANPELLAKIEAFQVAYVLDFDASKYDTQWNVDINTLKDKYNQLLDVTFNVWEYVRKIGFVADDTDMQIILPQLNTGEVWVKTDSGWRGLNVGDIESNINAFWVEFNKKTQEILEQIVTAGKVQEGLLEDFTQQKIKEINEEGLKLEVTQVGHGFIFNAVQFDKTTGAYTKADVNTGADGIAVRIDDDRFYLSSNGIIEIPANAVDSKGNPYELDEYYFLDNEVAGGCTPEKPIHIFQALFCVVNKKGVKSALVEIGDPIDLNPRILVDEINSLGLATTDQVVLSEPTIADLIASRKYKVGDVVQVLGYYSAGDGSGHPRKISDKDDGSGVLLINNLWANLIENSNVLNVKKIGVKGDGITDETTNLNKAINFARTKGLKIYFPKGNYKYNLTPDFDISDFVGEGIIKTVDQWGYTHDFNVYYCENGVPYTVQNKLNQGIRKQTLTRIGIVGDSVTDGAWGDGWTENPTTNGNLSSTDYNHSYQGGQNSWFKRFFDLIAKVKDAFVPCNCSVSGKRLIDGWAYRNFDYGFFQNAAYGNTAPEVCLLAMGINDNSQLQTFDAYRKEFDKFIRKAWGYGCSVGLVSISNQAKEWNYFEGAVKRTLKDFYKGVDFLDLGECLAEIGSQGVYPNLNELWKMSTNDTTHPKQAGQMAMGEYAFKHYMDSVVIKQNLFVPSVNSKVFIQGYPSREWYELRLGTVSGFPYLDELKVYPKVTPPNENVTITYFLDNKKENNSLTLFVPFQPNTNNVNKPNLYVNITNNGVKYYSKNVGTMKVSEYTTILVPNLRKGLNVVELIYDNEPNECYLPTLKLDELNLQNFTSLRGLSINPNNIYVQPQNFTVPTIQNSFSLSGNNSQLPDKVITIDSNYPLSTTVEIKKINGNALIESDKVGILFYYKNGVGKSVLFYKNADSYEINIFDNRTKTKTLISAFTKKPSEITGDFNLIFSYNQTTNNITCEMSTTNSAQTIAISGENISGGKIAILNEKSTAIKVYADYTLGLI